MRFDPVGQIGDTPCHFFTCEGEMIVNVRGDSRVHGALHEPVGFERAQRLREHLLADAVNAAANVAVAQCAGAQRGQH